MRVIRVDDDVWRALQKRAAAFEDTPNSVLRKVLKVNGKHSPKNPSTRIPRGDRTPQEEFRKPILQALFEKGGSERTAEVLGRVGELLGPRLTIADRAKLSHGETRWRNTAQWERNVMVDEGLLKRTSPRGVWELTDKGMKLAKDDA